MKKALKVSAIGFIIFALVTNIHTALFSFYGLKTNKLEGSVWAAGTSTSGTSSDGTSSSAGIFNSPVYTPVQCGVMNFNGTTTNGGGATATYNYGTGSVSVTYANSTSITWTGSVAPHKATMIECIGPKFHLFCSNKSAISACQ